MNKLALTLRKARHEKGLSLSDIEKLSDDTIAATYISGIERGAIPSPKKLKVLSKILKLDFLELMIMAGHLSPSDLSRGEK
jgi:transcriptional regulator with XRE-family HTH domain